MENFKKIDNNTVEIDGIKYTKDQDALHHKLLEKLVERIEVIEGKIKFISSDNFTDFIFGVAGTGGYFEPGISLNINGVESVTCYRTAVLIEKTKAVPVKIVSKDTVENTNASIESLTKDEKRQYKENGLVVVIKPVSDTNPKDCI